MCQYQHFPNTIYNRNIPQILHWARMIRIDGITAISYTEWVIDAKESENAIEFTPIGIKFAPIITSLS